MLEILDTAGTVSYSSESTLQACICSSHVLLLSALCEGVNEGSIVHPESF